MHFLSQSFRNSAAYSNQTRVSEVRIILCGLIELVGPGVDDRMLIDVVDSRLELVFLRRHGYGEAPSGRAWRRSLDKVKPGTMRTREGELKGAGGLLGESRGRWVQLSTMA